MKDKRFIGFYNYTVWLTYISLLSGVLGIMESLIANGRPYFGMFCLLFSGLCDTFDGKVARTKKNRTETEKGFGIQIDSLADIVAFGILPACIGNAMFRNRFGTSNANWVPFVCYALMLFYVLAAMIRLAYFNVTEEERQREDKGHRVYYEGLPVTSAALIFPVVMVIQYFCGVDLTIVYFIFLIITAFAFIFRFKVEKPGKRGIPLLLTIGAIEFILLVIHLIRS